MENEKIHSACVGPECGSFEKCSTDPDLHKLNCIHYIEEDFDNDAYDV